MKTTTVQRPRQRPHMQLVKYSRANGKPLCFVSHQWVSFQNPDPRFEQLKALQDFFKGISDGKILSVETGTCVGISSELETG